MGFGSASKQLSQLPSFCALILNVQLFFVRKKFLYGTNDITIEFDVSRNWIGFIGSRWYNTIEILILSTIFNNKYF